MIIHLHILGAMFVILSMLHVGFPRYFRWKEQLHALSLINRQMVQVHTAFIALGIFLMGSLCLTSAHELLNDPLGHRICIGLGVFWAMRLVVQLFVYSTDLWRGKAFETTVHILFTLLWTYATATFLVIGWGASL